MIMLLEVLMLFIIIYTLAGSEPVKETPDDIYLEELKEGEVPASTTEDFFQSSTVQEDLSQEWIDEAVLDVAHNLRNYKFNAFDRRYFTRDMKNITYGFVQGFPDPPLRSFHWEVHAFCSISFLSCLKYLKEKVDQMNHRRMVDTATIVRLQNWTMPDNREVIGVVDKECLRLGTIDFERGKPFQGPLEKFQWQTCASYYMCWYTMQDIPNLAMFGEPCDNYANCWDLEWGVKNYDFRADDRQPYACALFSFCPDPCCPKRHAYSPKQCEVLNNSACASQNDSSCSFDRSRNRDLLNMIYNHWNVSCKCPNKGFEWNSRYGMCIDINECETESRACNSSSETCLNLPGSFGCSCKFGYKWSNSKRACIQNHLLEESIQRAIKYYSTNNETDNELRKPVSLLTVFKKLMDHIRHSGIFIIDHVWSKISKTLV